MRRILLIIAIVIVLAGVGSYVYFRFFYSRSGLVITPAEQASLPLAEQSSTTPFQSGSTSSAGPSAGPTVVAPKLIRIASGPVVPGIAVTDVIASTTATTTAAYAVASYIDRASGNVYVYNELSGQITRTSDKTIPGIEEAYWLPDASLAYVQFLSGATMDTINTYGLPANGSGGSFLSQDLAGVTVSPGGVLTLASGENGSIASLSKTDGVGQTQVFSTPLSDIRAAFAGKNRYAVFTKPSESLAGYLYLVKNGQFSRVAGPLSGLVARVSPSGKWALVSYTDSSQMRMELVELTTGHVLALPIATIADKCAWTADSASVYCGIPDNPPQGSYPDDWYQGTAHFSDSLWRIDVMGRYAQLVDRISKEAGVPLDIERPAIDPDGNAIVFVNKNDGSLWFYKLQ